MRQILHLLPMADVYILSFKTYFHSRTQQTMLFVQDCLNPCMQLYFVIPVVANICYWDNAVSTIGFHFTQTNSSHMHAYLQRTDKVILIQILKVTKSCYFNFLLTAFAYFVSVSFVSHYCVKSGVWLFKKLLAWTNFRHSFQSYFPYFYVWGVEEMRFQDFRGKNHDFIVRENS